MLGDQFKVGDLVMHVDIPHNQLIGLIIEMHHIRGRAKVNWFLKFNGSYEYKFVEFKDLVKLK